MSRIVIVGCTMEDKVRPLPVKNHPAFWDLLKKLQNDRVDAGKETTQNTIALWKLTKTITNYFLANPNSYQALVEVEIKNV